MNILIAITLFLLLFWKLKNNYVSRTTLAYEYSIKALATRLEMLVVDHKVKPDNIKYRALNAKIGNMGVKLQYLNMAILLFFFFRDRRNKKKLLNRPRLHAPMISRKERRANIELSKIEKEFNKMMFEYVLKKNVCLHFLLFANNLGLRPLKRMKNRLSARLQDYMQYYIEKLFYRNATLSPFGM